MICHKRDLIACFRSAVNVTFVLSNIWMFTSIEKQTTSIDSLVSVQAKNNKMFGNYCLAALLIDAFLCLRNFIYFKQSLHTLYARLELNLPVICAMYQWLHYAIKRFRLLISVCLLHVTAITVKTLTRHSHVINVDQCISLSYLFFAFKTSIDLKFYFRTQ